MSKYRFDQIAINSKAKKKPTEEDKYHYIGLEHIDSQNLIVSRWGSEVAPKGEKLLMKKGDVLFGKRRAYQKKVAIAPFDGIFSAHGMVLRPNEEVVDKDFFPMFISSDYFLDAAIAISVGSLSPTINWKDLAKLEFDLPPMDEQKKLAKVLWSINDTLQAYQNLLTQTDALVQAQFVEMFGDLDANTKNYPVKKLSDIASYWNGLTYKPSDEVKSNKEGILVLRSSNIQNGVLNFEDNVFVSCEIKERLFVKENDILMCVRNGSANLVGKTAMINNLTTPMTFGAFMMIIRSEYYPFLKTYFETPFFRNRITTGTSTINQITTKMLNQIHIPIPDLDKVEQFDDFVCQAASSKSTLQKTITSLQATKRCILETALGNRGKE